MSGEPPTPNSVTVPLAADGSFAVFNNAGSVHVAIDVVWSVGDDDCSVDFSDHLNRLACPSAGTDVVATASFWRDAGVSDPRPGDAINFGTGRPSGDSCVGDVIISGAIVRSS